MNSIIVSDELETLIEPASWLIKIDFLNQFILNHNVLISFLGEQGGGKTTFAHLLQDKLEPSVRSVFLTASTPFDRTAFLENLCCMIDFEGTGSIATIAAQVNEQKSRTLLMIDDAAFLPESFVRELLDVIKQQREYGYFHVCLFSDFSLVKMTSRLARDDYKDMIHSIELQPLNDDEAKAYVQARIALHPENFGKISDKRFQQFFELTEGYIAAINTKWADFFSSKVSWSLPWNRSVLSYGVIPVIFLFVVGVGYLLFSPSGAQVSEPVTLADIAMDSIRIELPMVSDIPFYQRDAVSQPMQMVSLQKAALLVKNEEDEDNLVVDESLVVMDKVVPVPKVIVPVTEKKALKQRVKPQVSKIIHNRQVKKRVVAIRPKAPSQKVISPSGKYTIQLMASRNKSKLNRLVSRYPGVKMHGFNNHGAIWYVLTKGDFADKQHAQNALRTLPQNLAQFKPWVRSTSTLKANV